jgi:hypothetical protein
VVARERHRDCGSSVSRRRQSPKNSGNACSVCKYCRCSAAVTMVHISAEFVGPLGRHAICRQSNRVYASSCVFTMFNKVDKPATCDMRSVIRFLNVRNMKPAEIRQLCEAYREHAVRVSMVWRWVRHFIEGRENVHDDPRRGRPPVVNEDLVRGVKKIQENRQFTISSLSLHYPQISVTSSRNCL